MKKLSRIFSVFALILLTLSYSLLVKAEVAVKLKKSNQAIPNRYIVVLSDEIGKINTIFKNPVQGEIVDRMTSDLTSAYGGKIEKIFTQAIQGYSVEMSPETAEKLSQDARVKYIEADFVIRKEESQAGAPWGLDRIDQRNRPLDYYYNYDTVGTGVHAYVIDTGIRATHAEFSGRVVFGADFVGDGQNGNDCDGHGTHVAGIIGGVTYGVAKNVTLHNVRVLNCQGVGSGTALLSAVEWVTANAVKPAVVNISLGSASSPAIESAIANSIAQGINYALPAGNDNTDACNHSPGGRVSTAITVGATQQDDSRLGVSNYGACVDIFAPGANIFSAWRTGDADLSLAEGTSVASAHVAGMIARLLQTAPNASPADIKASIINSATNGVISNVGTGSPNRLLYKDSGIQSPPAPKIVIGAVNYPAPYPSIYKVSGLSGVIANTPGSVKVRINGFTEVNSNKIVMVLASPSGAQIQLHGGTGGSLPLKNISYTISDEGTENIPATTIANGATYKPTARTVVPSGIVSVSSSYNNPGPVNSGSATLSASFADVNPNGDWKLFVYNDNGAGIGAIVDWSLEITTVQPLPDPAQNIVPDGTSGFVGVDSFTKGRWGIKYGTEGYYLSSGAIKEPYNMKVTLPTTQARILDTVSDERIPQTDPFSTLPNGSTPVLRYSTTQFDIDFDFTDGKSHRVAIYSMDFNGKGRSQTFEVIDSTTGNILDTRSLSNFNGGKYLIWQLKGKYKIRVKNNGGTSPEAVYSGIFIDPAYNPQFNGSTARFTGFDTTTKGNWDTKYGENGYIVPSADNLQPFVQYGYAGDRTSLTWADPAPANDVRALPKIPNAPERIAAALGVTSTEYEMIFRFPDTQVHQLALYSVDWDLKNRRQTFEIIQGETGQLLDTRTISDFGNGVYSVWEVSGIIRVKIKNAGGVNAVVSGFFLDSLPVPPPAYETTVSFAGFDSATKGNWLGKYGNQGRDVFFGENNLPDWARYTIPRLPRNLPYVLNPTFSTTEPRAPFTSSAASNRVIGAYINFYSFDLKFDFTDGQMHRVALYSVDWGGTARKQTFEVINTTTGEIMDTRRLENFSGGIYTVWNLRGRFTIRIRNSGGTPNAAISALFIDQANLPLPSTIEPSASFVGEDVYTQGNWTGSYGGEGYSIVNDATNFPGSALLSLSGQTAFTWMPSTTDIRALKKSANPGDRIASTYYAPSQMEMNFYFTDGQSHRLALYALDWEGNTRQQTFELINSDTGAVLDTRTVGNFNGGKYLVWNVKGSFKVRVKKLAGPNTALSGIFIDPPSNSLPNQPPPTDTSATYVGEDLYTRGNWIGNYGAAGAQVIGDANNLPSFSQLTVSGQNPYTWAVSTTEARGLRKISNNADRIASTFYTSNQMDLNFNMTDGQAHRLALYALDWEGNNRRQTFELFNTETGALLDTRTISGYNSGRYVVWTVKGKITIRVKNAGGLPANAVLSGIFFDAAGTALPTPPPIVEPTATFVGADNYTKGNWTGNYGANGKQIIGDITALPTYAQLNVTGQTQYVWADYTGDIRALRKVANNTDRTAAGYYTPNQMDLNFDIIDGQAHRLALYALDWEGNGRKQTFELLNTETGAVLDTRTISGYNGGLYMVWTVKGKVTVRIKNAGGAPPNAVISGIFFDNAGTALPTAPPVVEPTAAFVGVDTYSKGNWVGNYGAEGKQIIGDSIALPAYAQLSITGQTPYTWSPTTTDIRALKKATNNADRIAATLYTANQMDLNFDLTDGQAHRLALYALDWEGNGRVETFELLNTETGAVLDTRTVSTFNGGRYVVWTVKGKFTVRIKNAGGAPPNAVISGIFFDAAGTALPTPPSPDPTSANFVRVDTNTRGNWLSNHGGQGYSIVNDVTSLPAYAQLSVTNQNAFSWVASTSDVRALIKPANQADRIAATYYAPTQFELNFNLTDGNTHRIALYALDWEGNTRQETFELVNTDSGAILDTRTISNFNTGVYVVWDVRGKVTVRVKKLAGANAVLSGIFFDSLTADDVTTGSFVGTNTTAQGNWMGVFGGQGSLIINDATNLPAYARMTALGQNAYTWMASTTDGRALTKATNNTDRIASTFYTPTQMDLSFYFTDEQTHKLSIYNLDWDTNNTRSQTLELISTTTGTVIDTRTISNFSSGVYTTWNVKGKVTVRIKKLTGPNAVISGVFIDN